MTVRFLAFFVASAAVAAAAGPRFEIVFAAAAHPQPVTGRVFVAISKSDSPEPRLQAGAWRTTDIPFFGLDVEQWKPGQAAFVDASVLGYPLKSLNDVPAGDYYVQALVNVYTQFHRSDGHTIWAHMDQWEGQKFNRSPGNLYSEIRKVHLDPAAGYDVRLELTKVIPPIETPPDTAWVKRVKIRSKLLSDFWGYPFYLGATVLLPRDYDRHPEQRYPVVYSQGHFGLGAPFGFTENSTVGGRGQAGAAFAREWMSDDFPRMIAVTFQHPTPYFDDSYAVNSANNGPYGDALFQELIPYLEEHFRLSRDPWERVLTGGSTGGWESLALQVHHPDFFGGTWTFYPDPIDLRKWEMINIYEDPNAFEVPGFEYVARERPMMRMPDGQVVETVRQKSQLEAVLGSKGRSGEQYMAWEAVYGPVGEDGYPEPLWDKQTGQINRKVSLYMRDHGYDLSYYVKTNWARLGPQLKDKLHLYCGDADNYFLNMAVYLFEDFMRTTDAGATFEYGRPLKGHGWQPMSNAELIRMMAAQIQRNRPGR
ncbi:MAG TPA: alpha/beta hydrolase-fold protein [Bryobacteraceae bacterium]|nr:alpha/beta hydrolase-fold protein [Bryobacteraceae bacterium]